MWGGGESVSSVRRGRAVRRVRVGGEIEGVSTDWRAHAKAGRVVNPEVVPVMGAVDSSVACLRLFGVERYVNDQSRVLVCGGCQRDPRPRTAGAVFPMVAPRVDFGFMEAFGEIARAELKQLIPVFQSTLTLLSPSRPSRRSWTRRKVPSGAGGDFHLDVCAAGAH